MAKSNYDTMMNISAGIDTRKMLKDIDKASSKIKVDIRNSVTKGFTSGVSIKAMDSVRKKMEGLAADINNVQKSIYKQVEVLNNKSAVQAERDAAELIKQKLEGELSNKQKLLKKELSNVEVIKEKMNSMQSDFEKSWVSKSGKIADQVSDKFSGFFSAVMSKDINSVFGLIQKGSSKLLDVQKKAATEKAVGGGTRLAKISGVLTKLAPALVAIGAIAGGFAAIVKVLMDVDAQAKGFNKTIIESGISVGDLVGGTDDLRGSLEEVRNAAEDMSNNMNWGTLTQDQLKILGAWNEAGYTLKEMAGGLKTAEDRMNAYTRSTSAALTYSNLLGDSSDKIAQDMTNLMETYGYSLQTIEEQYANIYEAANLSGFGTKRFFGQVLQATTGMSMYNVRLEQTTSMLLGLNKMLGTRFGSDFFNTLTKGFSEESLQDSVKRTMLLGPKELGNLISKSANYASEDFVNKIQGFFNKDSGKIAGAMASVFGGDLGSLFGDIENKGEVVKQLQKTLLKMTPEEQNKAIAKLQEKTNADLSRQLSNLVEQTRGLSGKLSDQTQTLATLDPGTVLASKFTQMQKFLGVQMGDLGKTSVEQQMAMESALGISRSEFEQLKAIGKSTQGSWLSLKDAQKNAKDLSEEDRKEQIKAYGVFVNEQGQIVGGKIDDLGKIVETSSPLKDQMDMLISHTSSGNQDLENVVDEQTALAQEMASNTTEMTQYLQMGVEYFLGGIYNVIEEIYTFLTGDKLTDNDKKMREEALKQERERGKDLQELLKKQSSELSTLSKDIRVESDPVKKRDLQDQIALKREEIAQTKSMIEFSTKTKDEIRRGKGGSTIAETIAQAQAGVKKDYGVKEGYRTFGLAEGGLGVEKYNKIENLGALQKAFLRSGGSSKLIEEWGSSGTLEENLKKWFDTLQESNKIYTDTHLKEMKHSDKVSKEEQENITKNFDKLERKELRNILEYATGSSISDRAIDDLRRGVLSNELKGTDFSQFESQLSSYGLAGRTLLGGQRVQDFILPSSGRPLIPSSNDTIVGMKPGGPLDKMMKNNKGNTVNNFYLMNDAQQTMVAFSRAKKAGVL